MRMRAVFLGMASLGLLTGAMPVCSLTVEVDQLRSAKGLLQICLTKNPGHFPECEDDPAAIKRTAKANGGNVAFPALPIGDYALAMIHDENANAKLDTFAGIPREGIGFSGNPKLTFGPPKFAKVVFSAQTGEASQVIRMKYFL